MVLISALLKILSSLAFSTLRILPLKGRIAWVARERAVFAEPPAESPSTIYISQCSGFLSEQSANLPGSESPSRADFLLVKSRAFLAASLALCDWMDFSQQDKLTVQNLVLLVGMLYKMCKVKLVLKDDNNVEGKNTINTKEIMDVRSEADLLLNDIVA